MSNPFVIFHPNKDYTTFVHSRIKWLADPRCDFMHAAIGLCGEAIEFQFNDGMENMVEELGDLEFYIEHAAMAFDNLTDFSKGSVPMQDYDLSRDAAISLLIKYSGDVLDKAKKIWVYNKNPRDVLRETLDGLLMCRLCIDNIYKNLSITRDYVQAVNVAKLKRRYPDGYTDQHAQARLDKTGA